MSKKQNVDSGKKEEEIMLFEIKAPGWSFAYAGLFQIEEVAEEICIELDLAYTDMTTEVWKRIMETDVSAFSSFDIDEFVRDEIWNNIYYTIQQTLENMKEEEEKTIYEFEIKCIEE